MAVIQKLNIVKDVEDGYRLKAEFRIEQLGNQEPYFAVTGDMFQNGIWCSGGCLHDDIEKIFPEYAKYIRWHLVSLDSPMYYIENSMYWAGFRGWCDGKKDSPPNYKNLKSTCIYDAVESDSRYNLEQMNELELYSWLCGRAPDLMIAFYKDMRELFPDFILEEK